MKKIKYNSAIVLFLISLIFTSCDLGGEPDPGGTTTEKYAGEWFFNLTDSDGNVILEHTITSIYNTSANDNTMWIDDHKNGYYIKSKVSVDLNNNTFMASDVDNLNDPGSKVTITKGLFVKNGAISKSGNQVDKITFTAHYSYDADGYDIIYEGHRRTGQLADEY